MPDRRIPLKDYVTDDMVIAEARENEWLWWDETSRDEETIKRDGIYEIIFIKPDEKTSIHYTEDYMSKVKSIVARGEEADKVIEEAENSLDCYSWQEILDEYATSENHKQKIQTIYIAGNAAPYLEYSPEHKKFFDNALQDEHPDVRIATIIAMGYMSWSEWIPVLYDLKNNDPDETVRDSAAGMLDSFAANAKSNFLQSTKSNETQEQLQPSSSQLGESEQLKQQLKQDKKQLINLRAQQVELEKRIENNRKTDLFGRNQGSIDREKDKLTQQIQDIEDRIAENESSLKALEEQE